jgi:hypothetical protein
MKSIVAKLLGPERPQSAVHNIGTCHRRRFRTCKRWGMIPGQKDDPDLYPVWSPTELGDALIRVGRKMVSLTQPDSGLN